jgi:hypothetical protein
VTRLGEFSPFGQMLLKLHKDLNFLVYSFPRKQFCIKFEKIQVGQYFGRLFHQRIWSLCSATGKPVLVQTGVDSVHVFLWHENGGVTKAFGSLVSILWISFGQIFFEIFFLLYLECWTKMKTKNYSKNYLTNLEPILRFGSSKNIKKHIFASL